MSKIDEAKKSVKLQNVVASAYIGHEIDLDYATPAMGGDYDPERFPGLVYRTKDPKTAALIFRSGKIVCTGAKSIEDVGRGLDKVFSKMKSVGIDVLLKPEFTVQNIVAAADLGCPINLNNVCLAVGLENVEYEPEQFPGLVLHLDSPKVCMLLFGSGKLVITGCKKPEDATEAVGQIVKELEVNALI